MLFYSDQLGNHIELPAAPKRIISLVPSQTELLHYLGLEAEVIGITKFCIHPSTWFKTKQRIGGTKQLNIEKIKSLAPDFIIANKEENTREQIEELQQLFPVWISDIYTLDDACDMISKLGIILEKEEATRTLISSIKHNFQLLPVPENKSSKSVLYLIWNQPRIAVGRNTFIHDMLLRMGLQNALTTPRYPELSIEKIKLYTPDYIFLSSEPFPFNESHIAELQTIFPESKILLVDGEMFSWYGRRLLHSVQYFDSLLKQL
jgi:ABC-type Fe3+-hydroxamate transport system substrate-binding protein